MNRRDFLRLSVGTALAAQCPVSLADAPPRRLLLLVELKGGNDGLNTVVPYRDPFYTRLRPNLALKSDDLIRLDERLGLNAALEPLLPLWRDGQMGVALGVGYPEPNRSHFRSIEIWETASRSDEYRSDGWLAGIASHASGTTQRVADGVVLGKGGLGPLTGLRSALVMSDPTKFLRQAKGVDGIQHAAANPAMVHLLGVQNVLDESRRALMKGEGRGGNRVSFPRSKFARDLANAAQLLTRRDGPLVVKVSHGSFDTHARQAATHARLLRELAEGLKVFRDEMSAHGLWRDTLVMTYSEFGRRPAENGSRGTDHGTAAPQFVFGGRVRGGIYGEQPSLRRLQDNDLVHSLDFRDVYATVERDWWEQESERKGLGFIRSL